MTREYAPGNEDYEYDRQRQRKLDEYMELFESYLEGDKTLKSTFELLDAERQNLARSWWLAGHIEGELVAAKRIRQALVEG